MDMTYEMIRIEKLKRQILTDENATQHRVGAMRVSGIKVLEISFQFVRNICFLFLETKAFAFRDFIPVGSWDKSPVN